MLSSAARPGPRLLDEVDDVLPHRRVVAERDRYVPLEQLCLSPQCGFSSTHHGNALSHDDQWRKLEDAQ